MARAQSTATRPQAVYAGTGDGGVFTSTNGGASWGRTSDGLTNRFVYALAIRPVQPRIVYGAAVNALAVAPSGDVVYAGTTRGRVFTC